MYGALQKKQVLWLKCLLVLDINILYLFNLQKNYKYEDLSVSFIPEIFYWFLHDTIYFKLFTS